MNLRRRSAELLLPCLGCKGVVYSDNIDALDGIVIRRSGRREQPSARPTAKTQAIATHLDTLLGKLVCVLDVARDV